MNKKQILCMGMAILIAGMVTGTVVRRQSLRTEKKIEQTQEQMAKEVLRFHILANSNRKEDQKLKMKVKEEVLSYMKQELPHSHSVEETKRWARGHEPQIEAIAEELIQREGYDYPVGVKVTKCEFPDKTYGDVTFPKGTYQALRITIGEAKGHNWWCVLYPNLCFTDATNAVVPQEGKEELKEVLTEEEYDMVTSTSKFKIKWFFLEENQ
ncbi:MAG: stage II sporulation protein R [Lachnospiraceae bacterium]